MKIKHYFAALTVICAGLWFIPNAPAATHVRIGVGVGFGGYGGYGYYPYGRYAYSPYAYGYPYYYGPTMVYTSPTVVYSPAVTTTTQQTTTTTSSVPSPAPAQAQTPAAPALNTTTAPPYGIPESDNQVKSPFSNFIINDLGMKPGTVVYDAFTGQPFRIP